MSTSHVLCLFVLLAVAGAITGVLLDDADLEQVQKAEYCARVLEYNRSVAAGEHARGHRDYRGLCNWEIEK